VVIFNFLNVHVGKVTMELRLLTEEFLELVREALPAGSAAPPVTAAPGPESVGGER
jgi:biopolymer transport protein ExbB